MQSASVMLYHQMWKLSRGSFEDLNVILPQQLRVHNVQKVSLDFSVDRKRSWLCQMLMLTCVGSHFNRFNQHVREIWMFLIHSRSHGWYKQHAR